MKKLVLLFLLIPVVAAAGIRQPQGECRIGLIEPSYIVSEERISYNASVYIVDDNLKPVSSATVEGAWMNKKGKVIEAGECETDNAGKCSISYVIKAQQGEKITELQQVGIRIIGVSCPNLSYTYKINSNFAWIIFK
jgi:hypothetical protein